MLKTQKSCLIIYEKTLVVVAYRLLFEVIFENNTEAPTFYQVRPVAQTALVFAVIARREFPFVVRVGTPFVRHFLYMFIIETLKIDRRQLYQETQHTNHYYSIYMQWVDFRSVESS
jgi:hypothetical protein